MLLVYQFTFAQNGPKSDISGALRPIHYITLKAFAMALGDMTKCKTCFVCPRMVLCGPRKKLFFLQKSAAFSLLLISLDLLFKCYRSKKNHFISTLEFLAEFAGCRWETHSEAFGIRSSGTEEYNTWSSKHQSADCRFPFKV